MLLRSITICGSLALSTTLQAQAPAIEWQRCLGGSATEEAQKLIATNDGGFLALSMTYSPDGDVSGHHGGVDIWLAKLDASGALQWQRALGGSGPDWALEVVENDFNEYLVLGATASNDGDVSGNHGGSDLWIVKLNAAGDLLWQSCLGGSGNEDLSSAWSAGLVPYIIVPTADGGCAAACRTFSSDGQVNGFNGGDRDIWVVKLSGAGALEWQLPIGGNHQDEPIVLLACADGGYFIGGLTKSDDGDAVGWYPAFDSGARKEDAFVAKISANGTLEWSHVYGGDEREMLFCARQTADGGFIFAADAGTVTGEISNIVGGGDWWLVKLDAGGAIEWDNAIGGPANEGHVIGIELTPDGGYMAFGDTYSADGGDVQGYHGTLWDWEGDYWVVKTDAMGEVEWQRCLGGTSADEMYGYQVTPDGGCIVGGHAWSTNGDVTGSHGSSEAFVAKLDDQGGIEWKRALGGSGGESVRSIVRSTDGGYMVMSWTVSNNGDVSGSHGGQETWCVKFEGNGAAISDPVVDGASSGFTLQPNPATGSVVVASGVPGSNRMIIVTDPTGRELLQERMTASAHTLDLTMLPRGVYAITLRAEKGVHTQRLVLE